MSQIRKTYVRRIDLRSENNIVKGLCVCMFIDISLLTKQVRI